MSWCNHLELTMKPVNLSTVAHRYGLTMRGPDIDIIKLGSLTARTAYRDKQLTYALGLDFLGEFLAGRIAACIVPIILEKVLPVNRSFLLTDRDVEDVFYTIFTDFVNEAPWTSLEPARGTDNQIARSAVIHDPVAIGNDCTIMDNVVILPNTRIGNRVAIKPNTTIGGDGFEPRSVRGRRQLVPHVGGVWIDDDVSIGSANCVDKGLFGEFTYVGPGVLTDNLVQIAHGCAIGSGCRLTACVELSGSVTLGSNVHMGPNSSVIPGAVIGDNTFVGIGANIIGHLPPHSLVYGNPAKVRGWVCSCRSKLSFHDEKSCCQRCHREYVLRDGQPLEVAGEMDLQR